MLVRKAEVLVFMGKAGSLSAADEALLDLVHPLAESSLEAWMQQALQFQRHVEYFPLGQPQFDHETNLDDVEFRTNSAVIRTTNRIGTDFLGLKHTPVVTTGLEVREDVDGMAGQADSAFGSDTILTIGDDYYLDVDEETTVDGAVVQISRTGILHRIGAWPLEPRSVKVTYYGGWAASQLFGPAAGAIKLSALETVANAFWAAKNNAGASAGRGPVIGESIGKYSASYGGLFVSNLTMPIPTSALERLSKFRSFARLFG